jgi:hypothetical protein
VKEGSPNQELCIHVRGGDIFTSNPHKNYVQPPLYYYQEVRKRSKLPCHIVAEDSGNPCVQYLTFGARSVAQPLKDDLTRLLHAQELCIGGGTFGLVAYFLNPYVEKIFVPDFFEKMFPWIELSDLEVISLPNFIPYGHWKNTEEQRAIYCPILMIYKD